MGGIAISISSRPGRIQEHTQKQRGDPVPSSRLSTRNAASALLLGNKDMSYNTDLSNQESLLRPVHVFKSHILVPFRGRGGGAYDDHYFPFEGEETLEVLELSLGSCFGGHDVRRQLQYVAILI